MPQELRSRLTHAAERGGNSLNREIVRRLEQSLGEEAAVPPAANNEGRDMTKTRFRLVAAAAIVAVAAIATTVLGAQVSLDGITASSPQQQAAKPTREMVAGNRGEPDGQAAEEDQRPRQRRRTSPCLSRDGDPVHRDAERAEGVEGAEEHRQG